jgi:hypothetical protein
MIWLLLIWALGIVTGGLHPIGLIFTMTAWFVYAAFSATLGMWFSVTCKTSLRATIWTITMMIATGVGHWLIWICVCGPLMAASRSGGPEKLMEFASKAQLGVLTPGFVLGFSAFSTVEISEAGRYRDNDWWWELAVLSLVGLVAWTIATGVLYSITSSRFRVLTHRASRIESDSARLDRMERARRRQARQSATPVSPWAPPPATAAPDDEQDDAGEFLTHSD